MLRVALGVACAAACGGNEKPNGADSAHGDGHAAAGEKATAGAADTAGASAGGVPSAGAPGVSGSGGVVAGGAAGSSQGGACATTCSEADETACQDAQQTVCVADANGCKKAHVYSCACFADGPCLTIDNKQWSGDGNASANGVAFDSKGNVYASASSADDLEIPNRITPHDSVLTKWAPDLSLIWAVQVPPSMSPISRGLAVDASDNAFIASVFSSQPGTSTNGLDVALSKVDPNGKEIWTKSLGSAMYDEATELAADASGNVFMVGFSLAALDVDPALGNADGTLVKWTPDGTPEWVRQFGSAETDYARSVAVDSSGNVYVTGVTEGDFAGTQQGMGDIFVVKYSSSGEKSWAHQVGGSDTDAGTGIACDKDAVYVLAVARSKLDAAAPGPLGETDIAVIKYDLAGNQLWLKQWGTSKVEGYSKIAVGPGGSIFLAGSTQGDIDITPTTGFIRASDLFVSEWSASGTPLWAYQWGTTNFDSVLDINVDRNGRIAVGAGVQAALPGSTVTSFGSPVVSVITPSSVK
jgi:hypothetical protein